MSWLSQAIHGVANAFKQEAAALPPEGQAQVKAAADNLHAAADAAQAVVPLIAEQAANAALARLGPLGIIFAPAVDTFIEALCAALMKRHSSSQNPAPAPAA